MIDDFSEGRVQFAFVKVKDPNTTLPKYVLIGWVSDIECICEVRADRFKCGEGVPERTKGYFTSHLAAVSKILHVCCPLSTFPRDLKAHCYVGLSCPNYSTIRSRSYTRKHCPKSSRRLWRKILSRQLCPSAIEWPSTSNSFQAGLQSYPIIRNFRIQSLGEFALKTWPQ